MPISQSRLTTAIALAISAGYYSPANAQLFPAEINVSDLDSSTGIALNGENSSDGFSSAISNTGDINSGGHEL